MTSQVCLASGWITSTGRVHACFETVQAFVHNRRLLSYIAARYLHT